MPEPTSPIDHTGSARRDPGNWIGFAVGLGLLAATLAIAPGQNCDSGGSCYPALVWIGRGVGAVFSAGFGIALLRNPGHGLRYDPGTGLLHWWRDAVSGALPEEGQIALSRIARVEIDERHETTVLRLIDIEGQSVRGFSEVLLPMNVKGWAERLVSLNPAIELRDRR